MAASAKPIPGIARILEISVDGGTSYKIVGQANQVDFSPSTEVRDITSQTTGGWNESRPGQKGYTLSANGFVVYGGPATEHPHNILETAHLNGTIVNWRLAIVDPSDGTPVVGEFKKEGTGFITQLDENAATNANENIGYSMTIQGTGEYTTAAQA